MKDQHPLGHGAITQIWLEDIDDGRGDLTTIERSKDVTAEVRALIAQLEQQQARVRALQAEVRDIKNRRGWSEVEVVHNRDTGLAAVVRTEYRWQAEVMRLEFDPQHVPAFGQVATEPMSGPRRSKP